MNSEFRPNPNSFLTETYNGVTNVTVPEGMAVNVFSAPAFRGLLKDVISDPTTNALVIDLSAAESIDSTGCGILIGALKQTRSLKIPLVIDCSEQPKIQRLFDATNLKAVFHIITSRKEYELNQKFK